MPLRRLRLLVCLLSFSPALAFAAAPKPCVTADEASRLVNKDVCVTAHIYDVVQLPDGTRSGRMYPGDAGREVHVHDR